MIPERRAAGLSAGLVAALLSGLLAAATAGAVLLAAPGVLREGPGRWFTPARSAALALAAVASAGLPLGLVLAVACPDRPLPAALGVAGATVLAAPAAYVVNVRLLPELTDPASVGGIAALLAAWAGLAAGLARLGGRLLAGTRPPRLAASGAAWLAALALAAGLRAVPAPVRPPRPPWPEPATGASRRTLVLVTIDALRADRLGTYGHARALTGVIDGLAAQGTVYERVIAQAPNTHPSLASMLTGEDLTAFDHLAFAGFLPDGAETLATVARARGYHTIGVVSNPWLDRALGFAQGFEVYDDRAAMVADAAAVTDAALAAVAASDRPLLLWVHYLDPHHPYLPPPPFSRTFSDREPQSDALQRRPDMNDLLAAAARGRPPLSPPAWRRLEDLYDGEVAHADQELGRLLDGLGALGRLADARIAVTADHGEEWRDHGGVLHAHTLYGELVRLPLVVWDSAPATPRGRRDGRLLPATAIAPLLLAGEARPASFVLSEKLGESKRLTPPLVALRTADWTLIVPSFRPARGTGPRLLLAELAELALFLPVAGRAELYAAADTGERDDLAARLPARRRELERELALRYRAGRPGSTRRPGLDDPALERLRGLGYLR